MAYTQNAGRDNLTNLNIAALTNGGTDPVKPFKPTGRTLCIMQIPKKTHSK